MGPSEYASVASVGPSEYESVASVGASEYESVALGVVCSRRACCVRRGGVGRGAGDVTALCFCVLWGRRYEVREQSEREGIDIPAHLYTKVMSLQ